MTSQRATAALDLQVFVRFDSRRNTWVFTPLKDDTAARSDVRLDIEGATDLPPEGVDGRCLLLDWRLLDEALDVEDTSDAARNAMASVKRQTQRIKDLDSTMKLLETYVEDLKSKQKKDLGNMESGLRIELDEVLANFKQEAARADNQAQMAQVHRSRADQVQAELERQQAQHVTERRMLGEEMAQSFRENSYARMQLDGRDKEIQDKRQRLDAFAEDLKAARGKLEDRAHSLDQQRIELSEDRQKLDQERSALVQARGVTESSGAEVDGIRKELDAERNRAHQQATQLAQAQQELEAQRGSVNRLNAELEAERQRASHELQAERQRVSQDSVERQRASQDSAQEFAQLNEQQERIAAAKAEMEKAQAQLRDSQLSHEQQVKDTSARLAEERRAGQEEVEKSKNALVKLQQEQDAAKQSMGSSLTELKASQAAFAATKQQHEGIQASIQQLQLHRQAEESKLQNVVAANSTQRDASLQADLAAACERQEASWREERQRRLDESQAQITSELASARANMESEMFELRQKNVAAMKKAEEEELQELRLEHEAKFREAFQARERDLEEKRASAKSELETAQQEREKQKRFTQEQLESERLMKEAHEEELRKAREDHQNQLEKAKAAQAQQLQGITQDHSTRLKAEETAATETRQKLEAQRTELQQHQQQLHTLRQELENKHVTQAEEQRRLQEEQLRLQQEMQRGQGDQQRVEELERDRNTLREQQAHLAGELQAAQNAATIKTHELEAVQRNVQERASSVSSELTELQRQCEALLGERDAARGATAQAEAREQQMMERAEERARKSKAETAEFESRCAALQTERDSAQASVSHDSKDAVSVAEDRSASLEQRCGALRSELDTMNQELGKLRKQHDDETDDLRKAHQVEVERIRSTQLPIQASQEVEEKNALDSEESDIASLRKLHAQQRQELESLRKAQQEQNCPIGDKASLTKAQQEAQEAQATLGRVMVEHNAEIENLRRAHSTQLEQSQGKERDAQEAQATLGRLMVEHDRLRTQHGEEQQRARKLEKRLAKDGGEEKRSGSSSFASSSSESMVTQFFKLAGNGFAESIVEKAIYFNENDHVRLKDAQQRSISAEGIFKEASDQIKRSLPKRSRDPSAPAEASDSQQAGAAVNGAVHALLALQGRSSAGDPMELAISVHQAARASIERGSAGIAFGLATVAVCCVMKSTGLKKAKQECKDVLARSHEVVKKHDKEKGSSADSTETAAVSLLRKYSRILPQTIQVWDIFNHYFKWQRQASEFLRDTSPTPRDLRVLMIASLADKDKEGSIDYAEVAAVLRMIETRSNTAAAAVGEFGSPASGQSPGLSARTRSPRRASPPSKKRKR